MDERRRWAADRGPCRRRRPPQVRRMRRLADRLVAVRGRTAAPAGSSSNRAPERPRDLAEGAAVRAATQSRRSPRRARARRRRAGRRSAASSRSPDREPAASPSTSVAEGSGARGCPREPAPDVLRIVWPQDAVASLDALLDPHRRAGGLPAGALPRSPAIPAPSDAAALGLGRPPCAGGRSRESRSIPAARRPASRPNRPAPRGRCRRRSRGACGR